MKNWCLGSRAHQHADCVVLAIYQSFPVPPRREENKLTPMLPRRYPRLGAVCGGKTDVTGWEVKRRRGLPQKEWRQILWMLDKKLKEITRNFNWSTNKRLTNTRAKISENKLRQNERPKGSMDRYIFKEYTEQKSAERIGNAWVETYCEGAQEMR